jgi:hypothetical protein
MSTSMIVCLTLLSLFTVVGVIAFAKSISPRHAYMSAFAYISEQLREDEYGINNRGLMICINNMRYDIVMASNKTFERAKAKHSWLVKEAVELELTPRQQLMLLDSLLDIKTNLKQATKITKVRSVKDIVELAAQYAKDQRKIEAPLALFY